MTPHSTSGNLQLIAGRDIEISGNADFTGLAAAHEQIELTGDLDVAEGAFLAEGACDSIDDRVDDSRVGGTSYVENTGPVATELGSTVELLTATSWTEL